MLLRFSYGKLTRPNQSTYEGAVTSYVESENFDFIPYGSSGAATAAPSTLIIDQASKNRYLSSKPFSAVHAALTAVTSTNDQVNII